jgi:TRAP-type C4-dicarboxylate transport system substrate-binding protein
MAINKKLRLIPKMKQSLAVVLAAGMAAFAQSAWSAEFEWRYYSVSPLGHPYSQILDKHFKEINKRSGDKLKIDLVYFGETPYKGAEAEKLMRDGLGQMTEWLVSYSTSTYPLLSAPELPFLPTKPMAPAEHIKAVDKAWESPSVATELESVLSRHKAVRLSRFYWPPQNHWLKNPINGADGFKGLKIREYSAEGIDFTTAIGATPVSMTAPDVYAALQRGALDGVVTASTSMTGIKWGEVLKAGYITNFKLSISLILVSKSAYDRLPPEVQTILKEEINKATDEILAFLVDNETKLHEQLKKDYGFTINYASPEDYAKLRQIAQTAVWPAWVKRVGPEIGKPLINDVLTALGAPERL